MLVRTFALSGPPVRSPHTWFNVHRLSQMNALVHSRHSTPKQHRARETKHMSVAFYPCFHVWTKVNNVDWFMDRGFNEVTRNRLKQQSLHGLDGVASSSQPWPRPSRRAKSELELKTYETFRRNIMRVSIGNCAVEAQSTLMKHVAFCVIKKYPSPRPINTWPILWTPVTTATCLLYERYLKINQHWTAVTTDRCIYRA